MDSITKILFDLSDSDYKKFQCKLMPTVDPDTVIGVRTPDVRALAKQLVRDKKTDGFIKTLPHKYYEENNLHAFILEQTADFDVCAAQVDAFLPFVDNWATCDCMKPKTFRKNAEQLLPYIEKWLCSNHTYTVRFGIGAIMTYFLDDRFDIKFLERVSQIKSDEYYINMMIAWFFATAFAKQYESTVSFIEKNRLSKWVHNKTIQKAVESYRITDAQKGHLKSLKLK